MSQARHRVDFDTLQRLDREADALIQDGRWTKDAFDRLWQEAVVASGGHEQALEFLHVAADPSWLAAASEDTSGVSVRIPRAVTEIILRLQRGWQPRLVLSRARSVEWNGKTLSETRADLVYIDGEASLRGQCNNANVANQLSEEMGDGPSGRIIRNSLRTFHEGGWVVEFDVAAVTRVSQPNQTRVAEFETFPTQVRAKRHENSAQYWISELDESITCRLGNLKLINYGFTSDEEIHTGWSRGNWCFKGTYNYFLVHARKQNRQYLIIDVGQGSRLERKSFHRDLLALKFMLGQSIRTSALYGLFGEDLTEYIGKSIPPYLTDRGVPIPAIDMDLRGLDRWIEPFFAKLAVALSRAPTLDLVVFVEAYISSRQGPIERQALELQMAILGLAHRALKNSSTNSVIDSIYIKRLQAALQTHAISVPSDLLGEVAEYSRTLFTVGRLTEEIECDDAELEREVRLLEILRTLLVAMIAASVGYRGPIRGIAPGDGSPSWWTIDPNEEQGIHSFVSVMAPMPIALPSIGAGDLLIIVECRHHIVILQEILRAARLPWQRVHLLAGDGKGGIAEILSAARESNALVILVAGSKQRSIPTAIDELKAEYHIEPPGEVLCAIPDIDAWLLADDELLRRHVQDDPELIRRVDELPLPEEIADPFEVVHRLIGPPETWEFVRKANIYRASVRSPSLRHFLSRIAELLGVELDLPIESAVRTISRDAIAGLIREMMPADTIAWRTSDGNVFSAEAISREVEKGTEIGHQYARDVMRVAIDFIRRQARRRGA